MNARKGELKSTWKIKWRWIEGKVLFHSTLSRVIYFWNNKVGSLHRSKGRKDKLFDSLNFWFWNETSCWARCCGGGEETTKSGARLETRREANGPVFAGGARTVEGNAETDSANDIERKDRKIRIAFILPCLGKPNIYCTRFEGRKRCGWTDEICQVWCANPNDYLFLFDFFF